MRPSPRVGITIVGTLLALTAPVTVAAAPHARADDPPACSWMDAGKSPDVRAAELVAAMDLEDKVRMVTGIGLFNPKSPNKGASGVILGNPRLCVPNVVLNDSSGGIGFQQRHTTAFPQGITQGSTWNRGLVERYGQVLADEAMRKGVNVILGPGLNMTRNPLSGRNLEYAGEDPFLTGQLGAQLIRGIQSKPVLANAKHYLLNEQEVDRTTSSSEVDPRTLHEIYLPPFEDAVDAGVGSVMCSYNRVASVHACENAPLLSLLKDELGFDGFVVSDWGATHSTAPSANAGLDVEMSGEGYFGVAQAQPAKFGAALKTAVQQGAVPAARLDDMVRRIVTPMFRLGLFEHPPAVSGKAADDAHATDAASLATAQQIATEGSVLLKNEGGLLPLSPATKRIAVIGLPASKLGAQLSSQGFGSNHVPVFGLQSDVQPPLPAIQSRAAANDTKVVYDAGSVPALSAVTAKAADVAVVFVANAETEANDRKDLRPAQAVCNPLLAALMVPNVATCIPLPGNQDALVEAVAKANPHTIVVLQNGGPLEMPWVSKVRSVVENWYPGQVDGAAVAGLLFGDANFSGKLPVTFPKRLADGPLRSPAQYPGVKDAQRMPHSTYSEKLLIGYRWYADQGIEPLFPFGHGLSYTSFAYSGLVVTPTSSGAQVRVKITNTGHRAGAEVAQVYLDFPDAAGEPPLQLKGFDKVALAPGETRTLTVELDERAFSVWDHGWTVTPGCYRVRVGGSSAELPLSASLVRGGVHC